MKNILKKIALSAAVIGFVGLGNAQTIDSKSKSLLDAVTANYNGKQNSYFKFIFGSGTNGTVTRTVPGIFYSSGTKYKLRIMETEQVFDGKKIYNVNHEDKEITVAKPNSGDQMFSPINYLTTYRKNFNVSYLGKKMVNGVNADFIKLTPVKPNGLKYVYLFIDSAKNQMVKLEQMGDNKDISVIAVTDYKENQTLDPGMFVFDKNKYKNYLLTEL